MDWRQVFLAGGVTLSLLGAPTASGESSGGAATGGTFRVAAVDPGIDPALSGPSAYVDATCALLLRDGEKPEVARRPPTVSPDGRTYTFELRRTFRFSTGTRVTAAAFAHEIDRVLSPAMASDAAQYFSDVVGADAVVAGKATHASGITAQGYTLRIRLTHPAPDFPARLTQPYACAVPPALPATPDAVTAPASGAGPYYVAEFVRGSKLVLRRNPYYGGSRPRRVGTFVVTIVADNQTSVDMVAANRADWADAAPGTAFGLTAAQVKQVHLLTPPSLAMKYLMMNTSRPLFRNNVRLRRAINFVIDRRSLARAYSDAPLFSARPTDQYLPPAMPGFRDVHLYPVAAPDVPRAQSLARGHTRSGRAVLYTPNASPGMAAAASIKRDLGRIGIAVEVVPLPVAQFFDRLANLDEPYDLVWVGWQPAFVDPYDVLNSLLDGRQLALPDNGDYARFNSAKYNRLLARAARLRGSARYRAYGRLDVQLARDAAPLAAGIDIRQSYLLSRRAGCVHLSPTGYLELATVCLRG